MPTQTRKTTLLATDRQNTVLNAVDATKIDTIPYSAYGHSPMNASQCLLRFNGELLDSVTGNYPLGNGYRMFSPVLMRFIQPDSWSPFGKGGLNTYAYCEGDSINRVDPTGQVSIFKTIGNVFGRDKSIITKQIDNLTHDIKNLKTTIIKDKKTLSKLEKIEKDAPDFIDRQNKRYMDQETAILTSSSNVNNPPSYTAATAVAPPSFEHSEILRMINGVSKNIVTLRKKIITNMDELVTLKEYRKILKRDKKDPELTQLLIRNT